MNVITSKQYQKYVDALDYDFCEMDIKYLIFKYEIALIDYYHNGNTDMDELELIIDAFLYFSQFEVSPDLEEYTHLLQCLLREKKDASEYTEAETLAIYSYMMADKLVRKETSDLMIQKSCSVLYKLSSTVVPIKRYVEQYGDVKSYLNELKKKRLN